jgi:hypothetical protein
MNEPPLTPDLVRSIVAGIRAGGFPHVAAGAQQVNAALFARWLRRGRRRNAEEPYRDLAGQVEAAQAQARLRAEMSLLEKDVRTWLKHGPGRDLPDNPGWAALVRPTPPTRAMDLGSSPEFLQLVAKFRVALASFPEALAALLRAIDELIDEKKSPSSSTGM